jgi:hypothetical protein
MPWVRKSAKERRPEPAPEPATESTEELRSNRDPQYEPPRDVHDEFWAAGPPPGTPEHRSFLRWLGE